VLAVGSGNEQIIKPIMGESPASGSFVVLDGPEDVNLFTIHKPFVLTAMRPTDKEADVQPAFVITFGEGEILNGIPVIESLLCSLQATGAAVVKLVEAFLSADNILP
jgi:hypothetical protein